MRLLIVMSGIPASGKSSVAAGLAERLGGVPVLSLDAFRDLMCPTHASVDGERKFLVGGYYGTVMREAYEAAVRRHLLEGSTLILDNTHTRRRDFAPTIALAEALGYEAAVIAIDKPAGAQWESWVEECTRRDSERSGTGKVGPATIDRMALRFCSLDLEGLSALRLDGGASVDENTEEAWRFVMERHGRCASPARIAVGGGRTAIVGDTHNRATAIRALAELVQDEGVRDVVFVGDLFDRGPDPAGSVRALMELEAALEAKGGRCVYVEGNHDCHIREILFNPVIREGRFKASRETLAALEAAEDGQDLMEWVRALTARLVPAALVDAGEGDTIVVTHGGISGRDAAAIVRAGRIPWTLTANDLIFGATRPEVTYCKQFPSDYTPETLEALAGAVLEDGTRVHQAHGHRSFKTGHPAETAGPEGATVWCLESEAEDDAGCVSVLLVGAGRESRLTELR